MLTQLLACLVSSENQFIMMEVKGCILLLVSGLSNKIQLVNSCCKSTIHTWKGSRYL